MEIANHFCEFFTNIGPNLAKMIPSSTSSFRSFLSGSFRNSIFLEPTTELEISEFCASFLVYSILDQLKIIKIILW